MNRAEQAKLEDLPPELRAQAEAKLGAKPKQKRTTQRTVAAGDTPGTCHICGEAFTRFGAWERHSEATGHPRWSIDVT